MRHAILCLVALAAILLPAASAAAEIEKGKPAPEFRGRDFLNGKKFDLESLQGRVVVLALLHTTSEPCKEYMGDLAKLMEEREAKGLAVVLLFEEPKGAAQTFLEETKAKYPAVADCKEMRKRYGLKAFPTSFVLDVDGDVQWIGNFADRAAVTIDGLLKNAGDRPYVPKKFTELRAKLEAKAFGDAHTELTKALAGEDLAEEDKARLEALAAWFGKIGQEDLEKAKKQYLDGDIWDAYQSYRKVEQTYAGLPVGASAKQLADGLIGDRKGKKEIEGGDYLREVFPEAQKHEAAGDVKKAVKVLKQVVRKFKGTRAADKAQALIDKLMP